MGAAEVAGVRLAMVDVDGTLRDMNTWLPGALDLLGECVAQGWVVALCSGRPANSLMRVVAEIDQVLLGAVGFIASGNGTAIWRRDADQWQLHHERVIAPEAIDALADWATAHNVVYWGFTAKDWIASANDELTQMIAGFVGVQPSFAPIRGRRDIMKLEFVSANYAQMFGAEVERVDVPRQLLEPHGLVAVSSVPGSLDVVPEMAAKTKGGDLLIADLGIDWENVFAVGNGGNDLGMLTRARVSAALPPMDSRQASAAGARLCSGPAEVVAWLRAASATAR